MNPIAAFSSLKNDLTHDPFLERFNLSLPVKICVKALTVVHWIWWFRRKKKLLKAETIVPAILGTLTDFAIKLAPKAVEDIFRGMAKVLLIATRVDECFISMKKLAHAFSQLASAFRAEFPPLIEPQWIKSPESIVFSVSTLNQWKSRGKSLIVYFRRIYHALLKVFVRIFELSMYLWDTYHAFLYSHDAMPEVFVSGVHWIRKLEANQEYFKNKLDQYEGVIQKIFNYFGNGLSARTMINHAKKILNGAAHLSKGVTKAGEALIQTGKKVVRVAHRIIIESKLLLKGLKKPRAHTPYVLKGMPKILWPEKPALILS